MATSVDEDKRIPSLSNIVRKRWRLALAFVGIFVLVGATTAIFVPIRYVAQAKLIAGSTNVNITAVPAFAEAGKSLAETYSRVFLGDAVRAAISEQVRTPVEATLDGQLQWQGTDGERVILSASPIAGSGIILIEAEAGESAAAVQGADIGAGALLNVVSGLLTDDGGRERAQENLQQAYLALGSAQARVTAGGGRNADAQAEAQTAQVAVDAYKQQLNSVISNSTQGNGLERLAAASATSDNTLQRFQLYVAVGLLLGVSTGLGVVYAQELSARTRLRRASLNSPADSDYSALDQDTVTMQRHRSAHPEQGRAGG